MHLFYCCYVPRPGDNEKFAIKMTIFVCLDICVLFSCSRMLYKYMDECSMYVLIMVQLNIFGIGYIFIQGKRVELLNHFFMSLLLLFVFVLVPNYFNRVLIYLIINTCKDLYFFISVTVLSLAGGNYFFVLIFYLFAVEFDGSSLRILI